MYLKSLERERGKDGEKKKRVKGRDKSTGVKVETKSPQIFDFRRIGTGNSLKDPEDNDPLDFPLIFPSKTSDVHHYL